MMSKSDKVNSVGGHQDPSSLKSTSDKILHSLEASRAITANLVAAFGTHASSLSRTGSRVKLEANPGNCRPE
jgi:hypothetical protein